MMLIKTKNGIVNSNKEPIALKLSPYEKLTILHQHPSAILISRPEEMEEKDAAKLNFTKEELENEK